jgi:hypothetical protein
MFARDMRSGIGAVTRGFFDAWVEAYEALFSRLRQALRVGVRRQACKKRAPRTLFRDRMFAWKGVTHHDGAV